MKLSFFFQIYVYLHDNPSAKTAKMNGPVLPKGMYIHVRIYILDSLLLSGKKFTFCTVWRWVDHFANGASQSACTPFGDGLTTLLMMHPNLHPIQRWVDHLANVASHSLVCHSAPFGDGLTTLLMVHPNLHPIWRWVDQFANVASHSVVCCHTEQLSASERKKLQRKQKKAQLKAQAAKAAEEKKDKGKEPLNIVHRGQESCLL